MPNRIIKESIRTSKSANQLSDFAFRLFVHLITYVDDFGRGSADPELIKGLCLPRRREVTEAQIEKEIQNLAAAGIVTLYIADGEPYLQFSNWEKHQQVRSKRSKFPAPNEGVITSDSICGQMISGDSGCPRNPIQSESNPNLNPTRTGGAEERSDFDLFWAAYPKKVGRSDAMRAFAKVRGVDVQTMIAAVEAQKKSRQWQKEDGQYIPNPSTWLNQGRWQDEVMPDTRANAGANGALGEFEIEAAKRAMQRGCGDG